MPKTLDDLCDHQALRNLAFHNRPAPPCDTRCYDLAAKFLENEPASDDDKRQLGGIIQEAIEDWIEAQYR